MYIIINRMWAIKEEIIIHKFRNMYSFYINKIHLKCLDILVNILLRIS